MEANIFELPAPAKGTGTKTSVLFLQRWGKGQELLENYPIFMAVSKKCGKDSSGEYIYFDERGQRVKSERGIFGTLEQLRLDDDLDEIAEEFIKFAKKQRFAGWE